MIFWIQNFLQKFRRHLERFFDNKKSFLLIVFTIHHLSHRFPFSVHLASSILLQYHSSPFCSCWTLLSGYLGLEQLAFFFGAGRALECLQLHTPETGPKKAPRGWSCGKLKRLAPPPAPEAETQLDMVLRDNNIYHTASTQFLFYTLITGISLNQCDRLH